MAKLKEIDFNELQHKLTEHLVTQFQKEDTDERNFEAIELRRAAAKLHNNGRTRYKFDMIFKARITGIVNLVMEGAKLNMEPLNKQIHMHNLINGDSE